MGRALATLPLLVLAACVAEEPAAGATLRARQEAACAASIAAHVRRPLAEVTPRWLSAAGGIATVETRDGNRVHLCHVDASGRVLDYQHPGA